MNILTCTDSRFVIPTGVMFSSICINNQEEELNFHLIIDGSVTESQKEALREEIEKKYSNTTLSFYLIQIEDIKKYLIVKRACFPVSIYYRLLLENILPSDIDKILYLDGDIVVRHNLKDLWQTDISDYAVGAVVNQTNSSSFWNRLGYPKEKGYFNSGVLLINLKYWREHELSQQYIKYIKENPDKLLYPDQDVLNVILQDSKKLLPERYNVQEAFYRIGRECVPCENTDEIEKAIYDPCIIHYTDVKPWHFECKHPFRKVYDEYRSRTRWKSNYEMEISHIFNKSTILIHIKRIIRKMLHKKVKQRNYRKI